MRMRGRGCEPRNRRRAGHALRWICPRATVHDPCSGRKGAPAPPFLQVGAKRLRQLLDATSLPTHLSASFPVNLREMMRHGHTLDGTAPSAHPRKLLSLGRRQPPRGCFVSDLTPPRRGPRPRHSLPLSLVATLLAALLHRYLLLLSIGH